MPEARADEALTKIAVLGTELSRTTSTEDVTATVADLDSRVATQTRSVQRVRELLDRAVSLADVVLLERELAQREADLEAVQARQRALADRAALATVTVTLQRTDAVANAPGSGPGGFRSGLQSGWDALNQSTAVTLTVLGAVLPF